MANRKNNGNHQRCFGNTMISTDENELH